MARSAHGEPASARGGGVGGAARDRAARRAPDRRERVPSHGAVRAVEASARPTGARCFGRRSRGSRAHGRRRARLRVRRPARLASASVATLSREAPRAARGAARGRTRGWTAFPRVEPRPADAGDGDVTGRSVVVEDGIPFVDFDATWRAEPPCWWRATADGAARGAWFGWDVAPSAEASSSASSEATLTMAPRLELTGSIPRRFIEGRAAARARPRARADVRRRDERDPHARADRSLALRRRVGRGVAELADAGCAKWPLRAVVASCDMTSAHAVPSQRFLRSLS